MKKIILFVVCLMFVFISNAQTTVKIPIAQQRQNKSYFINSKGSRDVQCLSCLYPESNEIKMTLFNDSVKAGTFDAEIIFFNYNGKELKTCNVLVTGNTENNSYETYGCGYALSHVIGNKGYIKVRFTSDGIYNFVCAIF